MKALGGLFGALWIFSHLTILRSTQLIVLSAAVGLAFLVRTRRLPRRSAMFGFGGLFALLFVLPYVVGGRMDVPNRPPSLADGKTGASPICPQLPGERDDASIRTPAYDPSDDRFDVSIDMLERTTTLRRWLGWAGFGRVEDYNVLASLYEQQREYPKSFGLYKEAADEGDKYGEFNVGRFYLDGRSPVKKPEAALEYLQLAADQNLGPAQYDLGVMYADGIGVKCDVSQAIALWFQAGRQGNAAAIAALGLRDLGHAQAMLDRAPIDMDFADPDTVIGAERKLMTFAAGFDAKRSLPDEKRKATIDAVKQECSVGVERIGKEIEDREYSQYDGLRSWHACYTKAESSLF